MLSKDKARLEISLKKESLELITMFADALNMKKSEFVEMVCLTFIQDVVKTNQAKTISKDKKEA